MNDQQARRILDVADRLDAAGDALREATARAQAFLAARPAPVKRPDEDDDAAIIEWFVRMQAEAEASYVIEAAAEAIANADGWDWHDDDYESPNPKWEPTDKAEYRETARKALAAARRTADARVESSAVDYPPSEEEWPDNSPGPLGF